MAEKTEGELLEIYQRHQDETVDCLDKETLMRGFFAAMSLYLQKRGSLTASAASELLMIAMTEDLAMLGDMVSRSRKGMFPLMEEYVAWKLGEATFPGCIRYTLRKMEMMEGRGW